jgi:hypothetical protein
MGQYSVKRFEPRLTSIYLLVRCVPAWLRTPLLHRKKAMLMREFYSIGIAALLESAGFNRAQVLKGLRSTAIPLGAAAWDPGYGFGLADVAAALHSGGN